MSFFDSPYVKRSVEEANFLRDRLINMTQLIEVTRGQDRELALEYLHVLYAVIEKEHLLYLRLRLSNDQEALIFASQLDGAKVAAESDNDYINGDHFYRTLKDDIKTALSNMDDTDIDDATDLW